MANDEQQYAWLVYDERHDETPYPRVAPTVGALVKMLETEFMTHVAVDPGDSIRVCIRHPESIEELREWDDHWRGGDDHHPENVTDYPLAPETEECVIVRPVMGSYGPPQDAGKAELEEIREFLDGPTP